MLNPASLETSSAFAAVAAGDCAALFFVAALRAFERPLTVLFAEALAA